MQKTLFTFTTMAVVSLTGSVHAATTTYYGPLGTGNVVPPHNGNGSGSTVLVFDDQTKELSGTVSYAGTTTAPTSGHIHEGACGENGPEVYAFPDVSKSPANVKVTLTAPQEQALVDGRLYVDFHTSQYPNGELRGQLFPTLKACPAVDAGTTTDAGTSADSGGPKTTPTPGGGNVKDPDAGNPASSGASSGEDDGGCAVAPEGGEGTSNAGAAFGAFGLAILGLSLVRRRRG